MKTEQLNLEFRPDIWKKTYCWDEEPVLSCSLALPVFSKAANRAGQRIARYYIHLGQWLRSGWEHQVFPAACAALQAARDASLPFQPYEETVAFQVTKNSGGLFSLYWDSYWYTGGAHGMTARWGDVWSLKTGCPMTMREFFPPRTDLKKRLPELAARQAGEAIAAGTSWYYEDYPERLRAEFDLKRFYLTEEALSFFYPLYAAAPYAEGIPTFTVPMKDGRALLP